MSDNKLHDLRTEYAHKPLLEADVLPVPKDQFNKWFDDAIKAEIGEPNAMTLSTVDKNGNPRSRIVLLKIVELDGGFVFFTNYTSAKGRELLHHANVALNFFWQPLARQVRIEGKIEKISALQSDDYFATRPIGSQLGASASPQSEIIESREWLEEKVNQLKLQFGADGIPRPIYWGGFKVTPYYFEFWQGRENRLHDRICYQLENNEWKQFRLAP